ncbi:hypothetical protein J2T15_001966 [Paenibacillus harenae]|uniref:Uncharacterized protein n=1 Tax=Paenibacillus harenae TaxID=306543 RepID=A0ABT9TYS7_PAEHA|nr:hypothetical protein [Paenibacillus harenae]
MTLPYPVPRKRVLRLLATGSLMIPLRKFPEMLVHMFCQCTNKHHNLLTTKKFVVQEQSLN